MKKIILISTHFGKLPKWIGLYLETCRWNPTVDWIIFSDHPMASPDASNVRWVRMTMPDLGALASAKLKLTISLENPRKICDLKPAYGAIFEDYLGGYDFWGHVDLDMLWGDIRAFMTDELLERYQIISAMPRHICGCFTLYKNRDDITRLYGQSPGYRGVLEDGAWQYFFDEKIFPETVFRAAQQGKLNFLARQLVLICEISEDFWAELPPEEVKKIRTGEANWRKGKIFQGAAGEELMSCHFERWKGNWCFLFPVKLRGGIARVEVRESGLRVYGSSRYANALNFIESSIGRFLRPLKPLIRAAQGTVRAEKKIETGRVMP